MRVPALSLKRMVVVMMMMTMMMVIQEAEAAAAAAAVVASAGPKQQYCVAGRAPGFILCHGDRITEMPALHPHNTVVLEIIRTKIQGLYPETFTILTKLTRLRIMENSMLQRIEGFAFANLPALRRIDISTNKGLETIGAYAFYNLSELVDITITKSKNLKSIHKYAFVGLGKLKSLIISNTGLEIFPDFNSVFSSASEFLLELEDNNLETVPPNAFQGLCTETISEIRLIRTGLKTVASDAFNGTQMIRLYLTHNLELTDIDPNAFSGNADLLELDVSHTAVRSLPESILVGLQTLVAQHAEQLRTLPPVFTSLQQANLTYPWHCCAFRNINTTLTTSCSPAPDAFNPCEDIMDATVLRVLIWLIAVLALLGNALVLLVLLGCRAKLTVPRFLMCHLAFADLCMGVYLIVIAMVDILTRDQYYNHAMDWQQGPGCSTAGFFTVFASELSVFTLTAITLERWHTITHALRLDLKLSLRHACLIMAAGWVFALLSALLPTVGVSSYDKVSICLPMNVDSLQSQMYVVSLLVLNVLAFVAVCAAYLSIYLTVRGPSAAPAHAAADTEVARRMAMLIFTDFLCMAPISFFAISAALKLPLITVSSAKLLLVLFYPINSCANPFLYAFFTRTFRRDFVLMAARFGLFQARAQLYRTETSMYPPPPPLPPLLPARAASPAASPGTLPAGGQQQLKQHQQQQQQAPARRPPSVRGRHHPRRHQGAARVDAKANARGEISWEL